MSNFGRGLLPESLDALQRLTASPEPNWWKDLMLLWRPSGAAAGEAGLRLAIRKNYLNFYFRGQSVGRVAFTPDHTAFLETHISYVFGFDEEIQAYVRLEDTTILHPTSGEELTYAGASTLCQWIERAAEVGGTEKACVDRLVRNSPAIIDLEMGLPAVDGKPAPRIDCVSLERAPNAIRIVFWEAKMIDDGRLRSNGEPEIVKQVQDYGIYLSDGERVQRIEDAYRTVCGLVQEIGVMAASLGNPVQFDDLIREAAQQGSHLKVDPQPRLVIFGGDQYRRKGNWPHHAGKLNGHNIPCLVFEEEPYQLRKPESCLGVA